MLHSRLSKSISERTMSKRSRLDDAQRFARSLLDDAGYREMLRTRLMAGELPAPLETLLFHYAYGKPVEPVSLDPGHELRHLSDDELAVTLERLRGLQTVN